MFGKAIWKKTLKMFCFSTHLQPIQTYKLTFSILCDFKVQLILIQNDTIDYFSIILILKKKTSMWLVLVFVFDLRIGVEQQTTYFRLGWQNIEFQNVINVKTAPKLLSARCFNFDWFFFSSFFKCTDIMIKIKCIR